MDLIEQPNAEEMIKDSFCYGVLFSKVNSDENYVKDDYYAVAVRSKSETNISI